MAAKKTEADDLQLAIARLTEIAAMVRNRRGLMAAVGGRVEDEYREHFAMLDNSAKNKLGGKRQHFWAQLRDRTFLGEVSDNQATITISDNRYRQKLEGGEIRPVRKKALAIPVHPLAYGLRAGADSGSGFSSFSSTTGIQLFKPGKKTGNPEGVLLGEVNGELEVFYALKKSVRQLPDPDAAPKPATISAAIVDEADDYFEAVRHNGRP